MKAKEDKVVRFICEHAHDMAALSSDAMVIWLKNEFPDISAGTAGSALLEAGRRLMDQVDDRA